MAAIQSRNRQSRRDFCRGRPSKDVDGFYTVRAALPELDEAQRGSTIYVTWRQLAITFGDLQRWSLALVLLIFGSYTMRYGAQPLALMTGKANMQLQHPLRVYMTPCALHLLMSHAACASLKPHMTHVSFLSIRVHAQATSASAEQ